MKIRLHVLCSLTVDHICKTVQAIPAIRTLNTDIICALYFIRLKLSFEICSRIRVETYFTYSLQNGAPTLEDTSFFLGILL